MTDDPAFTFSVIPDPWQYPAVQLRMMQDPLGGPNTIIQLGHRESDGSVVPFGKAVLYPIREGTVIRLAQGGPHGAVLRPGSTWQEMMQIVVPTKTMAQDWVVTVDEKEVLRVPFVESLPPAPVVPPIPWRTRVQARIMHWRNRARRSTVDVLATRLGYTRTGECDCDDDYY